MFCSVLISTLSHYVPLLPKDTAGLYVTAAHGYLNSPAITYNLCRLDLNWIQLVNI